MVLPSGSAIPVAVGKPSTSTPKGCFLVKRKVRNPNGTSTGFYGTMGIELSNGYGIHGTNDQNSIGKAASAGCIRVPRWAESQVFEEIKWYTEVCIYE